MDPDQLDKLFGLKPKYDIPPGAHRALEQGRRDRPRRRRLRRGFAGRPAGRADPRGARRDAQAAGLALGPHPAAPRAGSRLDAPGGMDPAEFVALRAALLDRMGEGAAARALVQDVKSASYTPALASAAFDAYLATGDLAGHLPGRANQSGLAGHARLADGPLDLPRLCGGSSEDAGQRARPRSLLRHRAAASTCCWRNASPARRARAGARHHRMGGRRRDQPVALRAVARARHRHSRSPAHKAGSTLFRNDVFYPGRRCWRRVTFGRPRGARRDALVGGDGRSLRRVVANADDRRSDDKGQRGAACAKPMSRAIRKARLVRACNRCGAEARRITAGRS